MREKYTELFHDYEHEFMHITRGISPLTKDIEWHLWSEFLNKHLSGQNLSYLCSLLGKIMYSKGVLDALEYKKSKKKENKKMKKNIKRTLDVIKLTSPSGDIKYVPGNTPLKTIMHEYPLWTMESCIIKASMPEEDFIQKANVTEIDNEEE